MTSMHQPQQCSWLKLVDYVDLCTLAENAEEKLVLARHSIHFPTHVGFSLGLEMVHPLYLEMPLSFNHPYLVVLI